jgi:hypothetical protein
MWVEGINFWRICRCAGLTGGLYPDVSHLATFFRPLCGRVMIAQRFIIWIPR